MTEVALGQHRTSADAFADHSRQILATTGMVMLGFVVVHLGGNMLAFAGSGTFNAYAGSIRQIGAPLIGTGSLLVVARIVLTATLVLHILAHLSLQTRPGDVPVSTDAPWFATLPVSVLQATGGMMLLFLVFHLLQLTVGATHPAFVADNPYQNLLVALRFWPVAVLYIAAAAAVGLHLLPGFWTGMASLGLIGPRTEHLVTLLSPLVALTLTLGMAAVPLAVLLGVLQ